MYYTSTSAPSSAPLARRPLVFHKLPWPEEPGTKPRSRTLLGGSWVVISGVLCPLIWVIIIDTLLVTPLITTDEPPSGPVHVPISGLRSLAVNPRAQKQPGFPKVLVVDALLKSGRTPRQEIEVRVPTA